MADLVQILRKTSVTPMHTFQANGVPSDIDSGLPTLAIVKPDGTAYTPLPTVSGSWTLPTPRTTGQYRFVLPRQLECTWLDYELTGNVGGEPQTLGGRVEWVGALLFTIADLRAFKVGDTAKFASATTWPDAKLHEARTAILDEFQHFLGFSPVPRFSREVVDGNGSGMVSLVDPGLKAHPNGLLSVTVDGVAQPVGNYTLKRSGLLYATSGYRPSGYFPDGISNVAVEYRHGERRVMGEGGRVAQIHAAMYLDPSVSSTASSVTTADGTSYSFDPAGQVTTSGRIRRTGIPRIDAWLNEWRSGGLAAA